MISPFFCKNFFIKSVDTPSYTRYSANHLLFKLLLSLVSAIVPASTSPVLSDYNSQHP